MQLLFNKKKLFSGCPSGKLVTYCLAINIASSAIQLQFISMSIEWR